MAAEQVFEPLIASTMGLHRLPQRAAFGACEVGWDPRTRQMTMHDPYGEANLVGGGYVSIASGSGRAQRHAERNGAHRWMGEGVGSR